MTMALFPLPLCETGLLEELEHRNGLPLPQLGEALPWGAGLFCEEVLGVFHNDDLSLSAHLPETQGSSQLFKMRICWVPEGKAHNTVESPMAELPRHFSFPC